MKKVFVYFSESFSAHIRFCFGYTFWKVSSITYKLFIWFNLDLVLSIFVRFFLSVFSLFVWQTPGSIWWVEIRKETKREEWYNNCRIVMDWCHLFFNLIIIQHQNKNRQMISKGQRERGLVWRYFPQKLQPGRERNSFDEK